MLPDPADNSDTTKIAKLADSTGLEKLAIACGFEGERKTNQVKEHMENPVFQNIYSELENNCITPQRDSNPGKQDPPFATACAAPADGERDCKRRDSSCYSDKSSWSDVDHYACGLIRLRISKTAETDGLSRKKVLSEEEKDRTCWMLLKGPTAHKPPSKLLHKTDCNERRPVDGSSIASSSRVPSVEGSAKHALLEYDEDDSRLLKRHKSSSGTSSKLGSRLRIRLNADGMNPTAPLPQSNFDVLR